MVALTKQKMTTLLLSSMLLSNASYAIDFFDNIDGQLDMSAYLAENAYGFLPVPILITEPAIGYGGGFSGVFLHESEAQKLQRKKLANESIDGGAQLLTPAISAVGGFKTDNGTWATFAAHRRSFKNDSIRYLVAGGYGDVNMTFYPGKNNNRGVELNMAGLLLVQRLQYNIADTDIFVGISQKYVNSEFALNNQADSSPLSQWANTTPDVSSLGLLLEYDSKNNFLYPTEGYSYIAEYSLFRKSLGSDYDFDNLQVEGINYWPINNDWTFAFRGQYKSVTSDERFLPPPAYPDIELRGIARNRYQGDYTAAVESQIMWQMNKRWSTSVFSGYGSAGGSFDSLFEDESHYSYGAGFRYLIARRYGLRTGMDFAFSEKDKAIYFQVGTGL